MPTVRTGPVVGLIAQIVVFAALGGTVGLGVGVPLWAYPLTQFQALLRYLALCVWPRPLVFEYGTYWARRAADVLCPQSRTSRLSNLRNPLLPRRPADIPDARGW